jgi:chemotaxis family two-component system response regulator Rcp1
MPFQQRSALKNPKEILLVEDSPGDIRLMQEAFKEGELEGHLSIARDGVQAMAFLRQEGEYAHSPRPSIILLDLNLPRNDGREVLAEIKAEKTLRKIPVVILSTSTSPEDIGQAYDLHANCYLQKPADLTTLVALGKLIEGFWLRTAVLAV